jgi:hypothetical protein
VFRLVRSTQRTNRVVVGTQGLAASFGENRNDLAKAGPQVYSSSEAFRGLTAKGWTDDSARCPDITVPLVRSRIG